MDRGAPRYRIVCTRRRPVNTISGQQARALLDVRGSGAIHVLAMHPERDDEARCRWCGEESESVAFVI
jgi:hypothetical protein